MYVYEELKDKLCGALEEINKRGDLNPTTLDQIDKLTHSIKSIDTIVAMENSGYSNESYARGRSPVTGRYVSREGGYSSRYPMQSYRRYSMDEGPDERADFAERLEELMRMAPDERTRNQLRKTISDVNNHTER